MPPCKHFLHHQTFEDNSSIIDVFSSQRANYVAASLIGLAHAQNDPWWASPNGTVHRENYAHFCCFMYSIKCMSNAPTEQKHGRN